MSALLHVVAAYAAATLVLLVIDLLWLRVLAKPRNGKDKRARQRRPMPRSTRRGLLLCAALLAIGMLAVTVKPPV